jgi:hypothetical protein
VRASLLRAFSVVNFHLICALDVYMLVGVFCVETVFIGQGRQGCFSAAGITTEMSKTRAGAFGTSIRDPARYQLTRQKRCYGVLYRDKEAGHALENDSLPDVRQRMEKVASGSEPATQ